MERNIKLILLSSLEKLYNGDSVTDCDYSSFSILKNEKKSFPKTLGFILYDNTGTAIDEEIIKGDKCDLEWLVPKDNTLIQANKELIPYQETDNYYIFKTDKNNIEYENIKFSL